MKIGVFLMFMLFIVMLEMILEFGCWVEEIGFDFIWLGEYVVLFDEMEFFYFGLKDGKIFVLEGGGLLDIVVIFGFLVGVMMNVCLGMGIVFIL